MYSYKPWTLFWVAGISAAAYIFFVLFRKWRAWSQRLPAPLHGQARLGKIAGIWLSETLFHRLLFSLSLFRWGTHLLIFWGFLGLALLSFFSGMVRVLSCFTSTTLASGDFTISDGDTNGRKVRVAAKTSITPTNGGTATHVALLDVANSKLLLVTTMPSKTFTTSDLVDTAAWDYELADPT